MDIFPEELSDVFSIIGPPRYEYFVVRFFYPPEWEIIIPPWVIGDILPGNVKPRIRG